MRSDRQFPASTPTGSGVLLILAIACVVLLLPGWGYLLGLADFYHFSQTLLCMSLGQTLIETGVAISRSVIFIFAEMADHPVLSIATLVLFALVLILPWTLVDREKVTPFLRSAFATALCGLFFTLCFFRLGGHDARAAYAANFRSAVPVTLRPDSTEIFYVVACGRMMCGVANHDHALVWQMEGLNFLPIRHPQTVPAGLE